MEVFHGICQEALETVSPSPLIGTNFHPFFTQLFSFIIESYLYENEFTPGPGQNNHS